MKKHCMRCPRCSSILSKAISRCPWCRTQFKKTAKVEPQLVHLKFEKSLKENIVSLLELLQEHSYKKGKFVLASGKKSDFFIDCKKITLSAEGHLLCGEVLFHTLRRMDGFLDVHCITAVPLGACPLASAVSIVSVQQGHPLDIFYVRTEQKDHGTKARVEMPSVSLSSRPWARQTMLIEDVVTTGGSSLRAARILRESNFDVMGVLALVDRLEGAGENLRVEGIPLRSIFTQDDFVKDAV